MAKPVIPRERANLDVNDAVEHYLRVEVPRAALDFVDALEAAYLLIGRRPGVGSPRYAQEMDLPGLRFWAVKGFPHLIFYLERDDHMDVWRVLHGVRDIPRSLLATGDGAS
jgi:toxin ParE1/3/4